MFVAQIQEGAPFDVFLSADIDYPAALQQAGLTASAPRTYAYGSLVLWALPDIDLSQGMVAALNQPKVKRIALANPQLAPYGRQTLRVLDYYQRRPALQSKLVYGESISQVTPFMVTEQVQLAFTAKSVVLSPRFQARGHWVEVPAESYQPIGQGAVILKYGATHHPEAAKRLMDFLFTPPAQTILERYGYRLP
jgi:molybdate transport system substrate-binding protein